MQPECQVKQFVAVVQGNLDKFCVFTTGSDRHYWFQQLDSQGCLTQLGFPVLKSRLRDDVRSALAHGWGNASIR